MTMICLAFCKWPKCLIQFEDFASPHCFELLHRYREKVFCFNDDIQGTGAVIGAGFLNAVKLAEGKLDEQRVLMLGAGSAAVGVADSIVSLMCHENEGLTAAEARKKFWLIDSKGIVHKNRKTPLEDHKVPYARDDVDCDATDLLSIVKLVKPTALIGLAGIKGGSFTPEVLKEMKSLNKKPIVFALSNPTSKSECTAVEAYQNTDGEVLFAAGSPFPEVEYNGRTYFPGQGNNMYIFPGLGFGAVLARAKKVTDGMINASAQCLASSLTTEERKQARVYPKLDRIRDISAGIAAAVIQQAIKEGVAQIEPPKDILSYVKGEMFSPNAYLDLHDVVSGARCSEKYFEK